MTQYICQTSGQNSSAASGKKVLKHVRGGVSGVHAPGRDEIPTIISGNSRSNNLRELQSGETDNTFKENIVEVQNTVSQMMEKGQKLRIISKLTVLKSIRCNTVSLENSREELQLL